MTTKIKIFRYRNSYSIEIAPFYLVALTIYKLCETIKSRLAVLETTVCGIRR